MSIPKHPWILVSLLMLGCSHPDSMLQLEQACRDNNSEQSCLQLGRAWLKEPIPTLAVAKQREAQLKTFSAHWDTDEFLALHGAQLTKLGGAYAQSNEVIKAVEAVDAGLTELETGRIRFSRSRFLRLTHILTLSHLPKVLGKQDAARDSLNALKHDTSLLASEHKLVLESLARLNQGGR